MKTVSLDLFDYSENITPADKGQSINLTIRELYQEPKQAAVIPVLALMPGALVPAYYHIEQKHFFLFGEKPLVNWIDPIAWCIPPKSEFVKPINFNEWYQNLNETEKKNATA